MAYCNLAYSNIILFLALKFSGVKKIIFHSHNTNIDDDNKFKRFLMLIYHYFSRTLITNFVEIKYACSMKAYKWLYGKECRSQENLIRNAIDLDKFIYNNSLVVEQKLKLFCENAFVIGHIGRFSYQKNHEFLINTFYEIQKKNDRARLLLIGEGLLYENIRNLVCKLNIENKVKFVEFTTEVHKYYQIMDVFVLPSLFEGLALVCIEAQASGLKCFFSENITKEAKVSALVKFLPLNKSVNDWAEQILSVEGYKRKNDKESLRKAGYDLSEQKLIFSKTLQEILKSS